MRKKDYDKNPNRCECCGKEIPWEKRRNRYCNHSCASSEANRGIRRHGVSPAICPICKKPTSSWKHKYCQSCRYEGYHMEYIDKWKKGEISGYVKGGGNVSNAIRRYLFDKFANKCEKCRWGIINEYTGVVPLAIHHIDGNHKNSSYGNLQLLCPNCHSLTKTYGAANYGNGREYRR